jgi:hypothetical protein
MGHCLIYYLESTIDEVGTSFADLDLLPVGSNDRVLTMVDAATRDDLLVQYFVSMGDRR